VRSTKKGLFINGGFKGRDNQPSRVERVHLGLVSRIGDGLMVISS